MTRRRFMFWLGFGRFTLADKLRADSLDGLAAAAMDSTEPTPSSKSAAFPEHWTSAEDENWRWCEREHFIDDQWWLTGTTTPIDKKTGERKAEAGGYLDDSLVPADLRSHDKETVSRVVTEVGVDRDPQLPDVDRRKRHGRPPSKWLRSLHADEIRIWLKTIKVPEADVSGMTFWTHLTRDHFFDPEKIVGLTIPEQAKLHAAAHYGY